MVRELLAIGVETYRDGRFVNLDHTHEDARNVCHFFRKELPKGYRFDRATLMKDPTATQVTGYLEDVLKRLDDDSVFIFYFSGHGLYNRDIERQLLLCADAVGVLADGRDGVGALTLDYMTTFSQRARGKVIFIYDVCREVVERGHKGVASDYGGATKFKTATSEKPDARRYGGTGPRWSFMSCGEGQRAKDDGSFVKAFLGVMRDTVKTGRELLLENESFVQRVYYRLGMGNQRPEASGDAIILAPAVLATERSSVGFAVACVVAVVAILFGLSRRSTDSGVKELKELIAEQSREIADQSHEITRKTTEITELERKNGELSKLLDEIKESGGASPDSAEFLKLKEENASLSKELAALKSQSASTTQDLSSKDAELAALSKRFEALQKSAESLKSELSSKDARIKELESQNATYETQITESTKKLTSAENDLAEARRENAKLKKDADATSRKLTQTETDLASAQSQIKDLKAKVETPTEFTNALGQRFVRIKSGKFKMGSPPSEKDRIENETQHEVTLTKDYYLCVYPVTRGDFAKFVSSTGYKTTAEVKGNAWGLGKDGKWTDIDGLNWRNCGFSQTDDHPVVCVSWEDAQKYIDWLNAKYGDELPTGFRYSLPTEAEWENGCRGGTTTAFFWGDSEEGGKGYLNGADESGGPNGRGWINSFPFNDGYQATSPVGTFKPNPNGLYDMLGNVWEWCQDWYGSYPTGKLTDPTGPTSGSSRVLRGGGWNNRAEGCRSAYRSHDDPSGRYGCSGFRLALRSAE